MNGVTVTMPINEYQRMKDQIVKLEQESIRRFVDVDYHHIETSASFSVYIKDEEIKDFFREPTVMVVKG